MHFRSDAKNGCFFRHGKNQFGRITGPGFFALGLGALSYTLATNCHHPHLMELDPKYCDVIVKRWQDFTGKQTIHEASGKTFDEMKAAKP
jgi:hypothetical protein